MPCPSGVRGESTGMSDAHHAPTVSTVGEQGFFTVRRIARIAIFVALSAVGALVKIPSPTGTLALDSAPAFLAAASFAAPEGAIIGALGHLLTAATTGFPLSVPVHLLIMAEMAVFIWLFGFLTRRVNVWVGAIVAVLCNSVVGSALMIPIGGVGMFGALVLPLLVGAMINVAVAIAAAGALGASGLADHDPLRGKGRRHR